MVSTALDIRVNGYPLALGGTYGDVQFSTVWPGGCGELSWSVTTMPADLTVGGADVTAYYGGVRRFWGRFTEPDPSQDRLVAQGLWRLADGYATLDGSGNVSAVIDTVIDAAIARGLPWRRPRSISNVATNIDLTQGPTDIGTLLDTRAENNTLRWGVDANAVVSMVADDTAPSYMTEPMAGGLGYATDNYASTLVCRYLDSGSSTYKTVTVTSGAAVRNHGYFETVVDLTPRGAITATKATSVAQSMLDLGRAVPQFTAGMSFAYGELLTAGGVPVALEAVQAGRIVRIHGGLDLARRLNGQMYVDVVIGQTQLADGLVTLQPLSYAGRSLQDALILAVNHR